MLIGITLAVCVVICLIYINIKRSISSFYFKLKPNCLLTRHPILFLSGKKSLFYFMSYWNMIPGYLQSHGYDVEELNLPWRKQRQRQAFLEEFFRKAQEDGRKYHVVGDSLDELSWLSDLAYDSVLDCWFPQVDEKNTAHPRSVSPEDLSPRHTKVHIFAVETTPDHRGFVTPLLWRGFVSLHNLVLYPSRGLNPYQLGIPGVAHLSTVTHSYLQFAVDAAEREHY
jgi:hypothetical protein